jgi:long-chain acyl-CoA synthetase
MEAALVEDHTRVWDAARAYGPTTFGGLPRFYEKAAEGLRAEQAASTGELRARWDRTLALGAERSRLRQSGEPVPEALDTEWTQIGAPVLARARAVFGGRMRLATSGGAALPEHVSGYLDALGVTVLGAYGLTEHLCVAFHRPDRPGFDSAGPPMPGTEIRIAADGEILVRRGPLTFAGYHGRPEETRAAFTPDGEWLLTGDLGVVSGDGCLRVTGRKKELIALSTGKKVAPLPIEALLCGEPWIAQAVVCGEGERFVSALLVLRRTALEAWARGAGRDPDDPALLEDPALMASVKADVERVNARLSRPEQVRRFAILARELSQDADELTPTLKLRRGVIAERYRGRLDELYRTA